MLTTGGKNEFIDSQKRKVHKSLLPIMDVKTQWNSTLEQFEQTYKL